MKVKFLADAILRLSDNRLTSTFYGDAENKDIVTFLPWSTPVPGTLPFWLKVSGAMPPLQVAPTS